MELLDLSIVGGAILFILLLWTVVGVRHLKHLKRKVGEQWEVVLEGLARRADILPNLIETVRKFEEGQDVLVERMIQERIREGIGGRHPSSTNQEYSISRMQASEAG